VAHGAALASTTTSTRRDATSDLQHQSISSRKTPNTKDATMLRILILTPWGMDYMDDPALKVVSRHVRPETAVEVRNLGEPVPALPWPLASGEAAMIAEARRAQAEGFDGLLIACSGDPYLEAVREAVDIPVSAPTDAALHLSRAFGKIAIMARQMPESYNEALSHVWGAGSGDFWQSRARESGMDEGDYSIRRVPIVKHPDLDTLMELTNSDPDRLRDLTLDAMTDALLTNGVAQAREAVEQDGADAIYFACTFWSAGLDQLSDAEDPFGVPVFNPLVSAATFLESAIISQARVGSSLSV
jgi:Asp/Glu/hydantoin racemase